MLVKGSGKLFGVTYVSRVLKILRPFSLIIPFLIFYPKEIITVVKKDLCIEMFPKALFITVEKWKQFK